MARCNLLPEETVTCASSSHIRELKHMQEHCYLNLIYIHTAPSEHIQATMVKKKELKPPPIEGSEDKTAPESYNVGTEFGADVPRTIRNRLAHETPQQLQHHEDEEKPGLMTKEELKEQVRELKANQQETAERYNRDHPGAGRAGKGDQAIGSMTNMLGSPTPRTRHGHT